MVNELRTDENHWTATVFFAQQRRKCFSFSFLLTLVYELVTLKKNFITRCKRRTTRRIDRKKSERLNSDCHHSEFTAIGFVSGKWLSEASSWKLVEWSMTSSLFATKAILTDREMSVSWVSNYPIAKTFSLDALRVKTSNWVQQKLISQLNSNYHRALGLISMKQPTRRTNET